MSCAGWKESEREVKFMIDKKCCVLPVFTSLSLELPLSSYYHKREQKNYYIAYNYILIIYLNNKELPYEELKIGF